MGDSMFCCLAECDRALFEFDPASFQLISQKRDLDQETFEQKTCFNNGGLVLVHRRPFLYRHTSGVLVLDSAAGSFYFFVTKTSGKVTL